MEKEKDEFARLLEAEKRKQDELRAFRSSKRDMLTHRPFADLRNVTILKTRTGPTRILVRAEPLTESVQGPLTISHKADGSLSIRRNA